MATTQDPRSGKFWKYVERAAAIAGALGIVSVISAGALWLSGRFERLGAEDLPATFSGEIWRVAKPGEFGWLQDDWCYPGLRGFRTTFRLNAGALERMNRGAPPDAFNSGWVAAKVYKSNHGMLRLWYANGWPGDYIEYEDGKQAEWRENQRFANDDGSIFAGKKRLVLSCARCSLSNDGLTYTCS